MTMVHINEKKMIVITSMVVSLVLLWSFTAILLITKFRFTFLISDYFHKPLEKSGYENKIVHRIYFLLLKKTKEIFALSDIE